MVLEELIGWHSVSRNAIWLLNFHQEKEAVRLFQTFCRDIDGTIISFQLFNQLYKDLLNQPEPDNIEELLKQPIRATEITYHASSFVCAVRRVERLLTLLHKRRQCFRESVREAITSERKKKRLFFEAFTKPRDAIEHIDGEINNDLNWAFRLEGDRFWIVDGIGADISKEALNKVCSVRDVIAEAIVKEYEIPGIVLMNEIPPEWQTKPLPGS